jgi:hypothetical protein
VDDDCEQATWEHAHRRVSPPPPPPEYGSPDEAHVKLGRFAEKGLSVHTNRATRGFLYDGHSPKWRDESALEFHRTPLFSHWIIQRMGPFETTGGEWLQVCKKKEVWGRWGGAIPVASRQRVLWLMSGSAVAGSLELRPVARGSLKRLKAMVGLVLRLGPMRVGYEWQRACMASH